MSVCISPENIKYRAEGNAAIVVSLIKEGTVLRLKKNASENDANASETFKELEEEVKVINDVWKLILGESFVNKPLLVFLEAEKIKILNGAISRFRPVHRMHKNVKEEDTYVFMWPDYCSLPQTLMRLPTCGPVLSIEIKLKQGFVKEKYVSSFQSASSPICSYCMMQRYKLKKGKISSKSKYCPSDLFSGCYSRMLHALKMLLETPQNNMRIFKDQSLIYSEEKKENLDELLSDFAPNKTRPTDLLCNLIIQALVRPFAHGLDKTPISFQKKFTQNCVGAFTSCCKHDDFNCGLPQYCVLERILCCQMLDDLEITELHSLYLLIKKNHNKHADSIGCYSRSEIPPYIGQLKKDTDESEFEYASRKFG